MELHIFLIKRFIELQEALRATIPNLNADLPIIPMEEWKCIEQICEVLQPFEEVTRIMSAENYLTASKAVVLTSGLINMCDELLSKRQFCDIVNILINHLKLGLPERFANIEKDNISIYKYIDMAISICTLLYPRFKQHAFEDRIAMVCTKEMVLEKKNMVNGKPIRRRARWPINECAFQHRRRYRYPCRCGGDLTVKLPRPQNPPKPTEEKCKEELEHQ